MVADIKLEAGQVLFAGNLNWNVINRKAPTKGTQALPEIPLVCEVSKIDTLQDLLIKEAVTGPNSFHSILLCQRSAKKSDSSASSVLVWGRNEHGQLGTGDLICRTAPFALRALDGVDIISAGTGKNHSLFVSSDGSVYSCGDNRMGQCGHSSLTDILAPKLIKGFGPSGAKIVKAACGADFSMCIDDKGRLWSFGSPEYSQLGLGSTHEYIEGRKFGFTPQPVPAIIAALSQEFIVEVACGCNHTAVVTRDKKVYTWGFGGYGRLGHNDNKDQYRPVLLEFFSRPGMGAVLLACGTQCTAVVSESGQYYLWGKWKTTGEGGQGSPWMYPRPVYELNGLEIRSIALGNVSLYVITDKGVISWGQNAINGELALGNNAPKSATKPDFIEAVDGGFIYSVSCGSGHTLFLAKSKSDALKDLPLVQLAHLAPEEPQILPAAATKRKITKQPAGKKKTKS